ncbi:BIM1 [Candida margitis]|uniref:BIM1 n=1 Tax=Candida margitis TaxID=1775924 RepID=UPI002227BB8C|nr:BIM1 [Candida margitis]KAI5958427.1 BIM1 [Candida margitis]
MLDLNYTKIEQCGTGAAFCQLMDSIVGGVALNKVKFSAKTEYDYRHNWKILQSEFNKHRITKNIDVERLIKCRLQDNLELLQWFKRYWNENADVSNNYDALSKRKANPSPYHTLNSIPTNSSPSLRRSQSNSGLPGSNNATIRTKRQISQSPQINQNHNGGYSGDNDMQSSDQIALDTNMQGHSPHDVLSSNYTSSNMSTRVRPRKSLTPTTSRISTPIQQQIRKTSDRSVRRMPSRHNTVGGTVATGSNGDTLTNGKLRQSGAGQPPAMGFNSSMSGNTSSSFQTLTSAAVPAGGGEVLAYTSDEHHHALANNTSGDNGYHISNEEVEAILQKNSELEIQVNESKLNCDTLQVERNFYFNKCRDIEILIQNIQSNESLIPELDVLTLLRKIEDTLYATQEGFSSEAHMLDSEF